MTEPRKNKPEVIARANKTRDKKMQEMGLVYARPKLKVEAKYNDEVRAAGLAAMKRKYKQLTGG